MGPGSVLEAVLTAIQCRGLSDYLLWQEPLRKALEESSWGQVLPELAGGVCGSASQTSIYRPEPRGHRKAGLFSNWTCAPCCLTSAGPAVPHTLLAGPPVCAEWLICTGEELGESVHLSVDPGRLWSLYGLYELSKPSSSLTVLLIELAQARAGARWGPVAPWEVGPYWRFYHSSESWTSYF